MGLHREGRGRQRRDDHRARAAPDRDHAANHLGHGSDCLRQRGQSAHGEIPPAKSTTVPPRPSTLEVMDDDIASVFVNLEAESAGPTETSVMKPLPQPPEEKVKKGLFGRAKQ